MDGPCQAWLCLVVPDPGSHRTEPNSLPGTSLLPSSPKPISHASGFHPQKPSVFVEIDLGDHAEEVRRSDHKPNHGLGGALLRAMRVSRNWPSTRVGQRLRQRRGLQVEDRPGAQRTLHLVLTPPTPTCTRSCTTRDSRAWVHLQGAQGPQEPLVGSCWGGKKARAWELGELASMSSSSKHSNKSPYLPELQFSHLQRGDLSSTHTPALFSEALRTVPSAQKAPVIGTPSPPPPPA